MQVRESAYSRVRSMRTTGCWCYRLQVRGYAYTGCYRLQVRVYAYTSCWCYRLQAHYRLLVLPAAGARIRVYSRPPHTTPTHM